MKKISKLAVLCTVFLLSMCFLSIAAYAKEPTDETVNPIIPDGTGTVVDVFKDESGRKFYTIQTPEGNTFYLVVDFTKQAENVYFLDAVNEKDLLALAEKANISTGESVTPTPNASGKPNSEPTTGNQTEPQPEQKGNTNNLIMFGVVFAVLIVGGTIFFIKKRKAKQNTVTNEYEDDEQEEYIPNDTDDYEAEPEDDSTSWEDDDE